MARELRNVAASVRARLQNLAREQQANFQRVLTRYALERFLFRLSVSPHKEIFILKGAMLYAAWLEDPFRMTRDLDLLSIADRESAPLLETIRSVCAQPVDDDGLLFDTENILAAPFNEDPAHGAFRVRTSAQQGNYQYAYLVQWKPVTRAVLSHSSLEEEVPRAFIKHLEARFNVRLEERNDAHVRDR